MELINWLLSEEGVTALAYVIPIALVLAIPLTIIARRVLFGHRCYCEEE